MTVAYQGPFLLTFCRLILIQIEEQLQNACFENFRIKLICFQA